MAGNRISSKTMIITHTRLSTAQQTYLMLFLAPEHHVSMQKPLMLIEETAHGSCRSTTASEGVYPCHRLSFLCVHVWRWDMQSGKPVRTSTRPLQLVLFFCFLFVIRSHTSAFSRWFPAGLHMTCDNITDLKGQAWREPGGGLGQTLSVQASTTVLSTHWYAVHVPCLQKKCLLWIFKHPVLNTMLTRQCKYLLYYLNLGSLSSSCREGAAIFACW